MLDRSKPRLIEIRLARKRSQNDESFCQGTIPMDNPRYFEWDETKRKLDIDKHGVDFLDAVLIFQDDHIARKDDRQD